MNMVITFGLTEKESQDPALVLFTEELAKQLPDFIGKGLDGTAECMRDIIRQNFEQLARAEFQAQVVLVFQRTMSEKQIFNVSKEIWEEAKEGEK